VILCRSMVPSMTSSLRPSSDDESSGEARSMVLKIFLAAVRAIAKAYQELTKHMSA